MNTSNTRFNHYCKTWRLSAFDEPIITPSSTLQKVVMANGVLAFLKITEDSAEQRGIQQLVDWAGNPAVVEVYRASHNAILLAYAEDSRSLLTLLDDKTKDDDVTKILAATIHQLHQTDLSFFSNLLPVDILFKGLLATELAYPEILTAQTMACELLAKPLSCVSLHGDAHHDNVLDFGEDGWRAIDPKGLQGEHYFDYAIIIDNPDLGDYGLNPQRFVEQVSNICQWQSLDQKRLIQWIIAHSALSAIWFFEDGMEQAGQRALIMTRLAISYFEQKFI